jgi:hypothetical protein
VSRSRSRSRPVGYRGPRAAPDAPLIEYGTDPLYDDQRRRSRSRGRSISSSGSDRRHRHHSHSRSRSRSRGATLATAAAAAGVTGLAVNEARKRRERKKEEKERRRKNSHHISDGPLLLGTGRGEDAATEVPRDEYYDPMQYYPSTNQFPPPPNSASPGYPPAGPYNAPPPVQGAPNDSFNPAPYNPAEYPPPAGPTMPAEQYYAHRDGVQSPSQEYYGNHEGGTPLPPHGNGYPHNPENVSAADLAPASDSREVSGGCF